MYAHCAQTQPRASSLLQLGLRPCSHVQTGSSLLLMSSVSQAQLPSISTSAFSSASTRNRPRLARDEEQPRSNADDGRTKERKLELGYVEEPGSFEWCRMALRISPVAYQIPLPNIVWALPGFKLNSSGLVVGVIVLVSPLHYHQYSACSILYAGAP